MSSNVCPSFVFAVRNAKSHEYKFSLCCGLLGALERAKATASLVPRVGPGLQQRPGARGEVIGGHPEQRGEAIRVKGLDVKLY